MQGVQVRGDASVGSVGLIRGRRGWSRRILAGRPESQWRRIHPSLSQRQPPRSAVVAEVDNGAVPRHAFEEARPAREFRCGPWLSTLLKHPMTSEQGSRLAHVHLELPARFH